MKIIFRFLLPTLSLIGNFSCQANVTNCVAIKGSCDNRGDYRNTPNQFLSNDLTKANNTGTSNSVKPTGYLVGKSAGSEINIYSQPSESSNSPHYGLVGDEVKILDRSSNSNKLWYRVQFPESGAIGWVQNEFIQLRG